MKPELQLDIDPAYVSEAVREPLLEAVERTFKVLNYAYREVTIVVTSDETIRRLNLQFRGQPEPTDVLAFPSFDPGSDRPEAYLGDIVISAQAAERQAREHGHSLQEELCLLAIHGLLHLLGYHDESPAHRDQMWAAQETVLRSLGLERINPSE